MQTFNVTSGPVVADYVTADREEELLRVLDAIGARDVMVGPEGYRVEITFVLDAENSDAAVTTADGTLTTFAGAWRGGGLTNRLAIPRAFGLACQLRRGAGQGNFG